MALTAFHSCLGCKTHWTDGKMESPCPDCGLTWGEWMYENSLGYRKHCDKLSARFRKIFQRDSLLWQMIHE